MDTISKITEALASFDSPVSPSTDPDRWLEANRDQILHIRDDSCAVFFDDQGSPYTEFSSTTVIYPVSCSAECESLEQNLSHECFPAATSSLHHSTPQVVVSERNREISSELLTRV